jgi:hypothetical protein
MSDTLHFEAASHTYKLLPRGIVLPSVSSILRPIVDFSRVPPSALEFARARGTAVHKACELFDLGTLDTEDLDPQLEGYVSGWMKFMHEFKPELTQIETPGYHKTYLYAGTPDRWATHKGKRILIDMKATHSLNPSVSVQLSGYSMMADAPADELWSVRLLSNGGFERTVHAHENATFMALLNVFMWKRKNA